MPVYQNQSQSECAMSLLYCLVEQAQVSPHWTHVCEETKIPFTRIPTTTTTERETVLSQQPTMSAFVVTADGKVKNIALKSRTLDETFEEYCLLFPIARDVEMQDIYVRPGDVVGTRECVSVFYDSGGFFQGKNKYFEGKTRSVSGAILAVWTRIAIDNTTACDDVLLDRPLTEPDFVKYAKSFEDDLAGFVRRGSHPQLSVLHYGLFPDIKRVWSKDGPTSYTVNGLDLRACRFSGLPSGGQYDVDLLTHRFDFEGLLEMRKEDLSWWYIFNDLPDVEDWFDEMSLKHCAKRKRH